MIVDPPPGGRPPADPNPAERAYLRRRAWDEIGRAGAAEDSVARLPHAAMARAYCAKCRAIADPRECADCTLRPLCQTLAASCRVGRERCSARHPTTRSHQNRQCRRRLGYLGNRAYRPWFVPRNRYRQPTKGDD
jgi:hypothetical protein